MLVVFIWKHKKVHYFGIVSTKSEGDGVAFFRKLSSKRLQSLVTKLLIKEKYYQSTTEPIK